MLFYEVEYMRLTLFPKDNLCCAKQRLSLVEVSAERGDYYAW